MNEYADENVLVDQRRIQAEAAVADGSREVLEVFCDKGHRVAHVHATKLGLVIELGAGRSLLRALPPSARSLGKWGVRPTFDVLADVEFLDCSCHCTFFQLDREKVTNHALNGPDRTHVRNVVSREV